MFCILDTCYVMHYAITHALHTFTRTVRMKSTNAVEGTAIVQFIALNIKLIQLYSLLMEGIYANVLSSMDRI